MCRVELVLPLLTTAVLLTGIPPVRAQPAVHTSCQGRVLPQSVSAARAELDRQPDQLASRLRLADALIDQGCYEDAVTLLEAGQAIHPHSAELAGKLRDTRSMITEQTYIQGITQAQEAAKLQHSRLRCTQLADLDACNEALKSSPQDSSLLVAKADVLMQSGRALEAAGAYEQAAQLSPTNESIKERLTAALARVSALRNPEPEAGGPPAVIPDRGTADSASAAPPRAAHRAAAAPRAAVVAGGPKPPLSRPATPAQADMTPVQPAKSAAYSNSAPAGRSN